MARRVDRIWVSFGQQVRDTRRARRVSARELAERARISVAMLYRIEAGEVASTDAAQRIAGALGRKVELLLVDPRRREVRPNLGADVVHSAMAEFEAGRLRRLGLSVGIDEPYQHYQFAGRADVVAWNLEEAALLHIENRTRFPDFQEMAGAYNAKKAYLGAAVAARLGLPGWRVETHVMAALWSAEVLHALRLRTESFRSLCPDASDSLAQWWSGQNAPVGKTSTLVLLDPLASDRQRPFISLDVAVDGARPRYRGYADAAARLSAPRAGEEAGPPRWR